MEDCPDGRMDRVKMQKMFKSVIPDVRNQVYINVLKFVNDRVMLVISFWSNCSVSLTKMETGALTSRSS